MTNEERLEFDNLKTDVQSLAVATGDLLRVARLHTERIGNLEELASVIREYAVTLNSRMESSEERQRAMDDSIRQLNEAIADLTRTVDRYINARGNGSNGNF